MIRAVCLVLLLGMVSAGCVRESGKPDEGLYRLRQAGILRVAMDPSYPPFSFLDEKGEAAGYDVDLSHEVATRLGVKVTFVGIDVTSVFDALVARRADAAISAVSPSWEYGKQIGFSRSYFNAGQVFVVRRGSRQEANPEELEAAAIGVEIGSTGELEGRKLALSRPRMSLTPFDSLEGGFDALSSRKVDAMIADRVTAAELLRRQKGLRIAGEPFTFEPYVIAVRASESTLLKEVDAILESMAADGFLKSLEKRWLGFES